jgi:hypothetical protein
LSFLLIVIISLIVLGVVAAIFSGGDNEPVQPEEEGNCTSCSSRSECKLAELKEKGQKRKEERCHPSGMATIALLVLLALTGCSTKNNTAKTRWWHAFNARYNTYFNGSQAFIEGSLEKEQGNKDN